MSSRGQDAALLGVCDGELDSGRHRTSYLTNKVGGEPDWPDWPRPESPCCGRCGGAAALLLQVYCPLAASRYHRTLHVFACPSSACSGRPEAWTALRCQGLEAPGAPGGPGGPSPPRQEATDWCDSAEDWGEEEEEEEPGRTGGGEEIQVQDGTEEKAPVCETDVSRQLQDLSLTPLKDVPTFRPFFISVAEESDFCGEDKVLDHAQQLLKDYERREGRVAGGLEEEEEGGGGGEKYEKSKARHGDAVFSRFMKTVSLCPQQILRYCRGGSPVFVTKPPSSMEQVVPRCSRCGGSRTFELQLMPALVGLLQRTDGSAQAELEFSTVLVYTCTDSCWTEGAHTPLEEFCFVQADPDQQLFK
ncbi:programmed cell death protein 2-like isoform X2 [Cololabis saira]|uniref:programmed cell death protein 2-like isoform X2 n=1 Tax=Cololabis saira TaxID=129043 RepID=UPI002AD442C0|nr:programmed cell death protein 2-like isoform X2 [Cololabis saira]